MDFAEWLAQDDDAVEIQRMFDILTQDVDEYELEQLLGNAVNASDVTQADALYTEAMDFIAKEVQRMEDEERMKHISLPIVSTSSVCNDKDERVTFYHFRPFDVMKRIYYHEQEEFKEFIHTVFS